MKYFHSYGFIILLIIISLLAFYVLFSERKASNNISLNIPNKKTKIQEEIKLSNPQFSEIINGKTKWRLKSDRVETSSGKTYFQIVSGDFFNEKGEALKFKAPFAKFYTATRDLYLSNEIELSYPYEKITLKLGSIKWDGQNKLLLGSNKVNLNSQNIDINADKVIFDNNLKKVKFLGKLIKVNIK